MKRLISTPCCLFARAPSAPEVTHRLMCKQRRILYRIIFPFAALFAVATALYWLLSAYLITLYLDRHSRLQMEQVAQIAVNSGFVLNPAVLAHLKQVISGELVVFDSQGEILSATFEPASAAGRLKQLVPENGIEEGEFFSTSMVEGGKRYRIILHPFRPDRGEQAILSIWFSTEDSEALKGRIIAGVGVIALAGIFAMVCVGYWIARTITAPIEELVRVTEEVSSGDRRRRVSGSARDEVGVLARSFNRMIEQLDEYEQRLVESERMAAAGRMAAGLAHEVRNPLTSIKMLAQVLHGRLAGRDEHQKVIRSLVGEIDRLDRIIQGIIDRTRPGEIKLEPADVNRLIDDVLCVMEASLRGQGIEVERCLDGTLPSVSIDSERFKQVLWNLMLNAKEAMPLGGKLSVETYREVDRVAVCIIDTGHGVAEEDREKIFQPFFTSKAEGMGLGLTISRKIVEKHGGILTIESRPGAGARALVLIPIRSIE